MVPDELNVYLWRDGFHLFFPMRGTEPLARDRHPARRLRDRDDVTFDESVPSLRDEAGARLSFQACDWFSTYRIHHRCTERFRDRRCFLLGDAAHVHSPMGGQGMNTGLQDAYNLAWKLALVVAAARRRRAARQLRGRAHAGRAATARTRTDRAFRFVVVRQLAWPGCSARGSCRGGRDRDAARAACGGSRSGRSRRSASAIARARCPGRSRRAPGAPQAGDRFPWLRLAFRASGPTEDRVPEDGRQTLYAAGLRTARSRVASPDSATWWTSTPSHGHRGTSGAAGGVHRRTGLLPGAARRARRTRPARTSMTLTSGSGSRTISLHLGAAAGGRRGSGWRADAAACGRWDIVSNRCRPRGPTTATTRGCSTRWRGTARVPPPPPRPSWSTTSSATSIATSCAASATRCWRVRFPKRSPSAASWP